MSLWRDFIQATIAALIGGVIGAVLVMNGLAADATSAVRPQIEVLSTEADTLSDRLDDLEAQAATLPAFDQRLAEIESGRADLDAVLERIDSVESQLSDIEEQAQQSYEQSSIDTAIEAISGLDGSSGGVTAPYGCAGKHAVWTYFGKLSC